MVFAGGGSKGAYQIGAWKALEELGERFDIAAGTSIGSINAGFYVQHDFDAAYEMWRGIKAENIMTNGINMDKSFERMFAQRESLIPFIKTYFNSKGADVKPFHAMLKKYFDPEKFFSSEIDYALVTVKFPSFSPVEMTKNDLRPYGDAAWQWLAASGAAFPVFPVMRIDGEEYVDGGYYDNIPVAPAFRLGAEEVTVIDLKTEKNHEGYIHHPRVRYVKPSRDLGTFLNFDRETLEFSIDLGYFDTMKAYGNYLGDRFTFTFPFSEMPRLRTDAAQFVSLLTESEARFDFSKDVWLQRVNSLPGCTTILADRLGIDRPDETELFVAATELLMELLDYSPRKSYDLLSLLCECKLQVDGMYPMLEYETETAFAYVRRFIQSRAPERSPALKALEDDRTMLILTAFVRALQRMEL